MRKQILLAIFLSTISLNINAQQPQYNVSQYRGGFAKEKLTVSNVAKALTSSVYAPAVGATCGPTSQQCQADYAVITVETDSIRWWPSDDPTSTDGHLVLAGSSITIFGFVNIRDVRLIRVTSDATIQVSYYRFFSNTP